MKQAVMTAPGVIEFRQAPKPAAGPGEVLIRVRRIGVCGSDIHVYHGLHPYTSYPIVQGHEVSGMVAGVGHGLPAAEGVPAPEGVGAGVSGFQPGDPVIFMPQVTCGECYPCRHGLYHICDNLKVMGFQTGGAAQEYFAVKAEMVLPLPASISLDQAAMIEPVSVAVHALRRGGLVAGQKVLVLGAGTIGNLVGQSARAMGAARVLVTDLSEYKLEMARAVGLPEAVNTRQEDLGAAIQRVFGPDKADLILECVGAQETITQAVSLARKGSTIVVVGVFGKQPLVDLGLVQDRELNLLGTLMYQKSDYEKAIELVAQGRVHLDPLITHRFPFEQYLDAYHAIEASQGRYMKVMIEL